MSKASTRLKKSNKLKRLFCLFAAVFFSVSAVCAAPEKESEAPLHAQTITADNVAGIREIFRANGYTTYRNGPDYEIPPLMVQNFPKDISSITDEKERHEFFIQLLAPLVLEANRKISLEREEILKLSEQKSLNAKQKEYLEKMAEKYDVFTRLKGDTRDRYLLKSLKEKVDIVTPSLVIGVSAIETNWGANRIAPEGNALFKEVVWYTDEGLKPRGETEDDTYRIKTYPSLYAAVEAFMLKMNSSVDFADMRSLRKSISKRKKLVEGRTMAHTMLFKSPLENYIGMLDYIITFYDMIAVDKSVLKNVESQKDIEKKK